MAVSRRSYIISSLFEEKNIMFGLFKKIMFRVIVLYLLQGNEKYLMNAL